MTDAPRLLTRIALFSALAYVLAWLCTYIPNVNLMYFVVFSAGFLWGLLPGLLVGAIGMGLWSALNPFGPADPVVFVAQVVGMALCGVIGGLFRHGNWHRRSLGLQAVVMVGAAGLCTVLYYLPVNFADAWVYQPFWPRFTAGLVFMLWTLVSNAIAFPLLFGITKHLYARERVAV
ncbi:ECF transporter S component [candidate division GN15 bacterium]|nr:ECF transporter S component [candidate division GN15 bacterium]